MKVMGVTKAEGIIPMEERLIAADRSRYKIVNKNWFAYNPMRLNIGSIARWHGKRAVLVSPDYVVFRCIEDQEQGITPDFLDHFSTSDGWQEFVTESGIGSVRVRIYYKDIAQLELHLPQTAEQQKIADCLSSLDELIATQARKVDALKKHKRGLMRQLFPLEGETQPRLRLPEFRAAPVWESDALGRIFKTSSGGTPSRSKANFWNGNIPWVTTSLVNFGVIKDVEEFITKDGLSNSSAKLLPKGTILIAMYGQGKTRGQVAMLGLDAATNQACAAITPKERVDPYFVFLNLACRYEELRNLSNSGGQENLSQGLIRELSFAYPLDPFEQHRIADCFTFLDDLITAATQELDTFKTHKKALMQQLFPSPALAAAAA